MSVTAGAELLDVRAQMSLVRCWKDWICGMVGCAISQVRGPPAVPAL